MTDENQQAVRVVEKVPEPQNQAIIAQDLLEQLRAEYDDLNNSSKDPKSKGKLAPQ